MLLVDIIARMLFMLLRLSPFNKGMRAPERWDALRRWYREGQRLGNVISICMCSISSNEAHVSVFVLPARLQPNDVVYAFYSHHTLDAAGLSHQRVLVTLHCVTIGQIQTLGGPLHNAPIVIIH